VLLLRMYGADDGQVKRLRFPQLSSFLDTVHHFADTYAYRDHMADAWRLQLINLRAVEPSPGLWQTSTDACCQRHKVDPLFAALERYDVWFTGLRREQSPSGHSWWRSNCFSCGPAPR
jgi:3'-phosphoadenosine 5'-phosphosulfate sulfotransferase (PAPS reductase)/FAD synthetase